MGGRTRLWWLLAGLTLVLTYTHYLSRLFIIATFPAILMQPKGRTIWLWIAVSAAAAGLSLPWALYVLPTLKNTGGLNVVLAWIKTPPFEALPGLFARFSGPADSPVAASISLFAALAVLAGGALGVRRVALDFPERGDSPSAGPLLWGVAVLPPILLFLLAVFPFKFPVWGIRHLVPSQAPWALLLAYNAAHVAPSEAPRHSAQLRKVLGWTPKKADLFFQPSFFPFFAGWKSQFQKIIPSLLSPRNKMGKDITRETFLVWSDEFEGPKGAPPNPLKWELERGGEGWGNHELQYYTDQTKNAALDGNSCLAITARTIMDADPANRTCWYGPCRFTSARLLTRGKFSFMYGVVEARIKIPFGQGIWPAFWMLGEDFGEVGWPVCGEIDIMENIGREPGIVHGTVHGPGYSGANGISGLHALPEGQALKDEFHIFAVKWQPRIIRWYMDNQLYFEVRRAQLPKGTAWPFDHPFFLLLNMAVGGEWPGNPDDTTVFPQVMLIDFVHVYQTN